MSIESKNSESCCPSGSWLHRRDWIKGSIGLGGIAMANMMAGASIRTADAGDDLDATLPHFAPRAKRVIFLFMHGGPSHVDTFDYKPQLAKHDGQPLPFDKPRIQFAKTGNLLKSPWKFRQYGQSGAWVSDLFPQVAKHVDDLAFIKSMHGSNEAHGGAMLKVHTGSDTFVRPSMGSWISYGLGSENENLPSFITINPTLGHGGVRNFGSAFLPPIHQATRIGSTRAPMKNARIENLASATATTPKLQQLQLDLLHKLDAANAGSAGLDAQLAARLESFELAFRMQMETPSLMDLSRETATTFAEYGIDGGPTDNFGRQCLLARRLSESGVRFVQVTHNYWDQHNKLKDKHTELAAEVDQPIAALLADLKRRGLLEDTLVIWGAEFGRTPTAQGKDGRDHNPHAFTYWMAGGGVKRGFSYGQSDEFGFYAAEQKVHIHDFHATLLHLLGINHERLTYRYGGRDFRLTDVEGTVISELFA
ncbi:protein containing DUF1501 [Rhodopirellula maiorica SM1]|uniref:Protein containing DUF1501 n=1 Tax=Rhodopirellula maiorica SM1 TaxID=1265738 RepID=M5RL53_9BACT|nr:DUF1501 domain-containing protein [Rhodopirellula maiorica]EMI20058.1 protein containing DUF1501 [Rhodopirellula maiorica SM1]